jgi:hypothetical protein
MMQLTKSSTPGSVACELFLADRLHHNTDVSRGYFFPPDAVQNSKSIPLDSTDRAGRFSGRTCAPSPHGLKETQWTAENKAERQTESDPRCVHGKFELWINGHLSKTKPTRKELEDYRDELVAGWMERGHEIPKNIEIKENA